LVSGSDVMLRGGTVGGAPEARNGSTIFIDHALGFAVNGLKVNDNDSKFFESGLTLGVKVSVVVFADVA